MNRMPSSEYQNTVSTGTLASVGGNDLCDEAMKPPVAARRALGLY